MRRAGDRPETAVEEVSVKVPDSCIILSGYMAEITRNHSDYGIESTPWRLWPRYCAHTPAHLLLTKLTQGVHACFNTATQTDVSPITTCDRVRLRLITVLASNRVGSLSLLSVKSHFVYLVKFQSEMLH